MFRTREEEQILMKHKHKELLDIFRTVLTKVASLKLSKLHVTCSADFHPDIFQFGITVFDQQATNVTLTIYDFWEVKASQKLINGFLAAIKTGDFTKVQAAKLR